MKNVFKLSVITLGLLLAHVAWGGCGSWYSIDPTCPGRPLYKARQAIAPTNTPAGCGSGNSYYALRYVIDPIGSRQFHPACVQHDGCYDTCGRSKSQCDEEFHNNMRQICGLNPACYARAEAYYQAVSSQGKDAYNKAQAAACH